MGANLPSDERKRLFYSGVRASIAWLHERAKDMNDLHARRVLNMAAFDLGREKPIPQNVLLDAARADSPPPTDDEVEAVARIILGKRSVFNSGELQQKPLSDWPQVYHVANALEKARLILSRPSS